MADINIRFVNSTDIRTGQDVVIHPDPVTNHLRGKLTRAITRADINKGLETFIREIVMFEKNTEVLRQLIDSIVTLLREDTGETLRSIIENSREKYDASHDIIASKISTYEYRTYQAVLNDIRVAVGNPRAIDNMLALYDPMYIDPVMPLMFNQNSMMGLVNHYLEQCFAHPGTANIRIDLRNICHNHNCIYSYPAGTVMIPNIFHNAENMFYVPVFGSRTLTDANGFVNFMDETDPNNMIDLYNHDTDMPTLAGGVPPTHPKVKNYMNNGDAMNANPNLLYRLVIGGPGAPEIIDNAVNMDAARFRTYVRSMFRLCALAHDDARREQVRTYANGPNLVELSKEFCYIFMQETLNTIETALKRDIRTKIIKTTIENYFGYIKNHIYIKLSGIAQHIKADSIHKKYGLAVGSDTMNEVGASAVISLVNRIKMGDDHRISPNFYKANENILFDTTHDNVTFERRVFKFHTEQAYHYPAFSANIRALGFIYVRGHHPENEYFNQLTDTAYYTQLGDILTNVFNIAEYQRVSAELNARIAGGYIPESYYIHLRRHMRDRLEQMALRKRRRAGRVAAGPMAAPTATNVNQVYEQLRKQLGKNTYEVILVSLYTSIFQHYRKEEEIQKAINDNIDPTDVHALELEKEMLTKVIRGFFAAKMMVRSMTKEYPRDKLSPGTATDQYNKESVKTFNDHLESIDIMFEQKAKENGNEKRKELMIPFFDRTYTARFGVGYVDSEVDAVRKLGLILYKHLFHDTKGSLYIVVKDTPGTFTFIKENKMFYILDLMKLFSTVEKALKGQPDFQNEKKLTLLDKLRGKSPKVDKIYNKQRYLTRMIMHKGDRTYTRSLQKLFKMTQTVFLLHTMTNREYQNMLVPYMTMRDLDRLFTGTMFDIYKGFYEFLLNPNPSTIPRDTEENTSFNESVGAVTYNTPLEATSNPKQNLTVFTQDVNQLIQDQQH